MNLLVQNLTNDFFIDKFNDDIKEMYASPESISPEIKDRSKELAFSLSEEFRDNIIKFYFEHNTSNMSDEDFDILFENFDRFTKRLIKELNSIQSQIIVYQSVALMWTGVFTQLERESKILDDIGMIKTSQYFCMELIKAQNDFYKSLKN